MTEYDVTVVARLDGQPETKETTTGGSKTTAAWLRAKADEIDPPKPHHRPPSLSYPPGVRGGTQQP